jgi:GH24 family phage-related lysozyme (muramidase)
MPIDRRQQRSVPKHLRADTASGVRLDAGPYIALVVNNIDPTRSGRLDVWIPDLGGEINDPDSWRTVSYASPFFGQTYMDQDEEKNGFKQVPHSYGFWMVPPDVGFQVLVVFVAGDPDRGYWIACIPPETGHHMVPAIGASTNIDMDPDEEVDPIVRQTREDDGMPVNGYPVADANPFYLDDPADTYAGEKPIHDIQYKILLEQGLLKDPIRGAHTSSSQRESPSSVYGFSTPGREVVTDKNNTFEETSTTTVDTVDLKTYATRTRMGGHVFVLDDGEYPSGIRNRLIKLRSSSGHQLLLNDSDDVIYIVNSKGNAWLEMTGDGQINMFTNAGFNVRTQGTLNLHADLDININAGRKLNLASGDGTQLDTKDLKIRSADKILVAATSSIGIKAGGSLDLSAGGSGSFGVSGSLTLCGSCVGINSGSAPPVETPPAIKVNSLPDARKESNIWRAKPDLLKTIVTIAPTHEPFARISGRSSTAQTTAFETSGSQGSGSGGNNNTQPVAVGADMIELATNFIVQQEGLPVGGKAYYDPPRATQESSATFNGTYSFSIGYGHIITSAEIAQGFIQCGDERVTIVNPITNTTMTPAQAKKLLETDIPKYVNAAKVPIGAEAWNKLSAPQQAALVSYAYNTGSTRSLVSSGLTRLILQDQFAAAGSLITTNGIKTSGGKVLAGLERRRSAETSLWNTSV